MAQRLTEAVDCARQYLDSLLLLLEALAIDFVGRRAFESL